MLNIYKQRKLILEDLRDFLKANGEPARLWNIGVNPNLNIIRKGIHFWIEENNICSVWVDSVASLSDPKYREKVLTFCITD